jgi:hypothetical protein
MYREYYRCSMCTTLLHVVLAERSLYGKVSICIDCPRCHSFVPFVVFKVSYGSERGLLLVLGRHRHDNQPAGCANVNQRTVIRKSGVKERTVQVIHHGQFVLGVQKQKGRRSIASLQCTVLGNGNGPSFIQSVVWPKTGVTKPPSVYRWGNNGYPQL